MREETFASRHHHIKHHACSAPTMLITMTMNNSDLLALKSYITAKDEIQYDLVQQGVVVLDWTHSNLIQNKQIEIRFYLYCTTR